MLRTAFALAVAVPCLLGCPDPEEVGAIPGQKVQEVQIKVDDNTAKHMKALDKATENIPD